METYLEDLSWRQQSEGHLWPWLLPPPCGSPMHLRRGVSVLLREARTAVRRHGGRRGLAWIVVVWTRIIDLVQHKQEEAPGIQMRQLFGTSDLNSVDPTTAPISCAMRQVITFDACTPDSAIKRTFLMCISVSRPPSPRAVVGTQREHTGQKNVLSSESDTGRWFEHLGQRLVAVTRLAGTGDG